WGDDVAKGAERKRLLQATAVQRTIRAMSQIPWCPAWSGNPKAISKTNAARPQARLRGARHIGPVICGPGSVGNAGAMQAPNEALQEGFVAAEEDLLPRQSAAIVRLAAQQLGCSGLKLRTVRQIAEGGNKCCERAVCCIGLAGGTLGKRGCQLILAHRK